MSDEPLDEPLVDELMQLVGDELFADADPALFGDIRFVEWLSEDLRASMSSLERAKLERDAERFARRLSRRIAARRMEARIRRFDLNFLAGNDTASREPVRLFDLEVAAGTGR